MARAVFTPKTLARSMRPHDRISFSVDMDGGRERIVSEAAEWANRVHDLPAPFRIVRSRNKPCVHHVDYNAHLTYRTIARYIALRFRVSPLSRDAIVRGVLEALEDTTPMWIVRKDISSFYETIPTADLQARLLHDTAVPSILRNHLRLLFTEHSPNSRGLPRGVGLAATLAEMAMNDFDRAVRALPGVYRYFRFSDDILIFSYKDPAQLEDRVQTLVTEMGMSLNARKSKTVEATNTGKVSLFRQFEYLGYKFTLDDKCYTAKARPVTVSISDKKITRVKTRVLCALRAFACDGRFNLLYDRIRYLSANYTVYITKSSLGRSSKARAGIYYSYKHCGLYRGERVGNHDCAEIKALDGFYHSLLSGAGSEFRAVLAGNLVGNQMNLLKRVSFFKGFETRYLMSLSASRISRIKKAWQYVE